MIDHVVIPVRDLDVSRRFYEPLFDGLGAKVVMGWEGGVLFGTNRGRDCGSRESTEIAPAGGSLSVLLVDAVDLSPGRVFGNVTRAGD